MAKQYPKNMFKIGANNIGDTVLDGVHYYNIPNEEKAQIKQIEKLQQEMITLGMATKNYLNILKYSTGETIIIKEEVYEDIAKDMFKFVGEKNPKLKSLVERIDIKKSKKYEIEQLCEFICSQPENEVDIYMYKMRGKRTRKIFIEETLKTKEVKKWIKEIKGYRLTLEDIEKVNEMLSERGKKITNVVIREMLNREDGIRMTLEIGEADFIKI